MLLKDRTSIKWMWWSVVTLAVVTLAFVGLALFAPKMPRGGTIPGLVLGGLGTAMILITLLLSARKAARKRRVGRVYTWMQAHVWFGTLSYPIIILHAWGSWGGPLTQWLMWSFTLVFVSGIVGLALQQVLPDLLIRRVPRETVADQVEHVIGKLREEAAALVETAGRGRDGQDAADAAEDEDLRVEPSGAVAVMAGVQSQRGVREAELAKGRREIAEFFRQHMLPVLQPHFARGLLLGAPHRAEGEFLRLRNRVPKALHETVDDLRGVIAERHELRTQRRIQWWLHTWLVVHVPVSFAMFVLALVHIFTALRYSTLGGL